jgi:hypothetical protein
VLFKAPACQFQPGAPLLLHALGYPAVLLTREDHPGLAVVGDSNEMRAILRHARPIVDQYEMEIAVLPPRPRFAKRHARGFLHRLAVPPPVRGPRLLQRMIGRGDVLEVRRGLPPIAKSRSEETEDEREKDHRTENNQDDGKR